MSDVDVTPRSRRAILGAALGGVAASIAAAIGRPAEVAATDDAPLVVGQANTSAKTTSLQSSLSPALNVTSTAVDGIGVKGTGEIGVQGTGSVDASIGVVGLSPSFTGPGIGVYGSSNGETGVGVLGESEAYQGVTGYVGAVPPGGSRPTKTGVFGWSDVDSQAIGVAGRSGSGRGVQGTSDSGTGVQAQSTTGTALAVSGRATFSRSGTASIPAGQKYVDITPPGGLAPTTFIVATLQAYRTGTWVIAARKNYPSTGKVRLVLNKVASTTTATPVGWIAIN